MMHDAWISRFLRFLDQMTLRFIAILVWMSFSASVPVSWERLSDDNTFKKISSDPIPAWPRLFSMDFNETSIILFKRMTEGGFQY